jgi:predicted TIM-barrel fold metal-dependent hydrolase
MLRSGAVALASSVMVGCQYGAGRRLGEPGFAGDIDAHCHIWTPDLRRYPLGSWMEGKKMSPPSFSAEELLAVVRPNGVDRVVLIQHAPYHGYDNSYILDMVDEHDGVFSAVAMIDERKPNVGARLRRLRAQGARGIRIGPTVHADRTKNPDPPNWLKSAGMKDLWKAAGEHGVHMCPLVAATFLPTLDPMLEMYPETTCIIDHFGRVDVDPKLGKMWMQKLARHPNVYVKMSAFKNYGDRRAPYQDLIPLVQFTVDAFGPERLMWGSDNPYQLMNGNNYPDCVALIREQVDSLSKSERIQIMRGTAEQLFF